jgi:chromate transporter
LSKSLPAIFFTFLKIGAFTFGGAYAMIPLIKRDVVERQNWLTEEEFLDGLAAAQSCPGPIAVNLSVYIGLHLRRGMGMCVAVLGTVLPSLITIILIAALFSRYAEQAIVRRAFHALKPALVALIVVPLLQMGRSTGINFTNFWVPVLAMLLVGIFGISPVWLILATIVISVLISLFRKKGLT